MKRSFHVKRCSAFTLIELLVTVTIITLLCAILLPSLQAARRSADGVCCLANLSQLAKAWTMYLDAHNGFFYQKVNANLLYGGWIGKVGDTVHRPLNPFLGLPEILEESTAAEVFQCPCDNRDVPYNNLPAFTQYGTSYQMNVLFADQIQIRELNGKQKPLYVAINKLLLPRMNISRAADPARLLLMGDYGWVSRFMPGYQPIIQGHDTENYYTMAFMDGHVKFIKIRKGLFVCPEYRVQPFEALDGLSSEVQEEED